MRLGFYEDDCTELRTGTTDPSLLYVVRKQSFGCDFLLNRGMPGAGGISTQAAELCALGVKYIVHIGTYGLVSSHLVEGRPIVSVGAYKDAAAMMLSHSLDGQLERIARPSAALTKTITDVLGARGLAPQEGVGYTVPIFYLQPSRLLVALPMDRHFRTRSRSRIARWSRRRRSRRACS
jgi:uridine phosphorylase